MSNIDSEVKESIADVLIADKDLSRAQRVVLDRTTTAREKRKQMIAKVRNNYNSGSDLMKHREEYLLFIVECKYGATGLVNWTEMHNSSKSGRDASKQDIYSDNRNNALFFLKSIRNSAFPDEKDNIKSAKKPAVIEPSQEKVIETGVAEEVIETLVRKEATETVVQEQLIESLAAILDPLVVTEAILEPLIATEDIVTKAIAEDLDKCCVCWIPLTLIESARLPCPCTCLIVHKECIRKSLKKKSTCPVCNQRVEHYADASGKEYPVVEVITESRRIEIELEEDTLQNALDLSRNERNRESLLQRSISDRDDRHTVRDQNRSLDIINDNENESADSDSNEEIEMCPVSQSNFPTESADSDSNECLDSFFSTENESHIPDHDKDVAEAYPPIESTVSESSKDIFSYVSLNLSHITMIESLLHIEMNICTSDEILKVDINKKRRIREGEDDVRRLRDYVRRLRDDYHSFQDQHQDFFNGEDREYD
jgi:hypothetical protein